MQERSNLILNLRKIDKFWLSGGWQNVIPEGDIAQLKANRIKAVLDLQFLPAERNSQYEKDNLAAQKFLFDVLKKHGIEYAMLPIADDEYNDDLEGIFNAGHEFLSAMEEKYPDKRDAILVKCGAGVSRSASMLINHLCETRRMSYVEALNYVRDKESAYVEFGASPHPFFAKFLKGKFKDNTYV